MEIVSISMLCIFFTYHDYFHDETYRIRDIQRSKFHTRNRLMHGCRSLYEQINRTYVGREISETRKPQRFCNPPTVSIVSAIGIVKNRCRRAIDVHRGLISIDRTSSPPPLIAGSVMQMMASGRRIKVSRCAPINFASAFKFPYRCNAARAAIRREQLTIREYEWQNPSGARR